MTYRDFARSTAILGATAALFLAGPALAQPPAGDTPSSSAPTGQPATPSFSDEDLEAYVKAEAEVVEISSRYEQEYGNETDPEKLNEVRQEMNEEMISAVTDSGIELEKFNEIARALQTDPELAQKVAELR